MNNFRQMLAKAQQMQSNMAKKQKEMEVLEVGGVSGNGAVTVTISVKGDMKKINISDDLMVAEEKEMLEDLIVAAFNDAKSKADKIYEDGMKEATGGFSIPGF